MGFLLIQINWLIEYNCGPVFLWHSVVYCLLFFGFIVQLRIFDLRSSWLAWNFPRWYLTACICILWAFPQGCRPNARPKRGQRSDYGISQTHLIVIISKMVSRRVCAKQVLCMHWRELSKNVGYVSGLLTFRDVSRKANYHFWLFFK